MSASVFFSWQSDIRAAACRTLIQDALTTAAGEIARDESIAIDPVIDRDTQGVPGCPDIGATIFAKIEAAEALVADVTIVSRPEGGRPSPNPNVLIELGYALKALGEPRIILVQNTAFGGPELLPFDLRQKRVMGFCSPTDATERASERRGLQHSLERALRDVLKLRRASSTTAEVALTLDYVIKKETSDLHQYELVAAVKNTSTRRIDDWHLELELPTPLVEPHISYGSKVVAQSNEARSLFRTGSEQLGRALQFGETRDLRVGYRVDKELYFDHERWERLFSQLAVARAFVDGKLVAVAENPMQEMQRF